MDSRSVNKLIRRDAWSALRDAGFTAFTSRTAWRYTRDSIDVVNFQSFSAYLAASLGCTTFSFGLNLGKYLRYIPYDLGPARVKPTAGGPRPTEYQCNLRRPLQKTIVQGEFPRPDIWYIEPSGSNLDVVFENAVSVLPTAVSWFAAYESPQAVFSLLRGEPEDMSGTWGFGRNPSPIRYFYLGFTALHVGAAAEAHEYLTLALKSGCFAAAEPSLRAGLNQATGSASA